MTIARLRMTQARPPKKSEVLEIRIPYPTKTAFMEKAHAEGRAASEIVREQIDAYLERAAEPEAQSFADKAVVLIRRNLHGAGLMLAGAGSALAISLAASPATALSPARTGEGAAPTIVVDVPAGGLTAMELGQLIGQAFARLDSDGNGILSPDETAR
jgi:hypothetical protein